VRTLLAKEPENRFQTAKELADSIEEVFRQRERGSEVRERSAASAPGAVVQKYRRFWRSVARGTSTSFVKVVSTASAIASSGVSNLRERVARWRRGRRNRSIVRTADRRIARAVVASRQIGRETTKVARRFAAWAKVAWVKTNDFYARWLPTRRRALVLGSVAVLGMIVLLVVMLRGSLSPTDDSARQDRSGTKHPASRSAKSSKSQR
jgi:hypothetical protein